MLSEIYRNARNVLMERGWHQGDFTPLDEDGIPVTADGPVCLYGAVHVAAGYEANTDEDVYAADFLSEFAKFGERDDLGIWNDEPSRHLNEVLDVLDVMEKVALQLEESK